MANISDIFEKIIIDGKEVSLQSLISTNGNWGVGKQRDVEVKYIFKDSSQIPANLFYNLKQLKWAYFPSNIKIIGNKAFANSNLSYINDLSNVNYIGNQSLSYTKLTYVYGGDGPSVIEPNAWSYISTLTEDFKEILLRKYPYIDFGNMTYVEPPVIDDPFINVTSTIINVSNNGGQYEISYTIVNPISGINISASTNSNWISNFNYNTSGQVKFNVSAQETNSQQRSATIILSYGNISKTITIIQAAGETIIVNNPIINVSPINLNCEHTGGEYTINYTITNPIQGSSISARTSVDWISNITYTSTKITFNVSAQEENATERTTTITLSYPNANDVIITFTQGAYVANGGGPEPTNKNGWYRVESSSWLNVGDRIIIASADDNYAMSTTQNTSNRGISSITKSTDENYKTCTISNDIQEFILESGIQNNTFALRCISGDEAGKYIYAASNSSNQLKTYTSLNDNGSFRITFESNYSANIVSQGSNSKNTIRYNSSSSVFSCYESGQNPIVIYKYYTTDINYNPIINISSNSINISNNGGEYEIEYNISNPINGISINAISNVDWLSNFNYSISNKIRFNIESQSINTPERTATITLSYTGASDVIITIIQAAGEVVSTDPAIIIDSDTLEVPSSGGLYTIGYNILNANGVDTLTVNCIDNWVNNINVQSNLISFNINVQNDSFDRIAILTLSYPGAQNVTLTITQSLNTVQPLDIIANFPTINGLDFSWKNNNGLNVFAKESNTNNSYTGNYKFVMTENNILTNKFVIDGENVFDSNLNYDIHASFPYYETILDDPNTTGYIRIGAYSCESSVSQTGYNNTSHLVSQYCPLYGYVNGVPGYNNVTINMNYLLSIIKVRVVNSSDKTIIIKNISITTPEDIIGSYTVDFFNSSPIFTAEDPMYVSNTVNLKVKNGEILPNNGTSYADFYVAIKPFTLSANSNLIISVNGYQKTITLNNDMVFASGVINNFDFDYDIVININEPSNKNGWYRIEKEEWLSANDKVIIVSNSDDYAMSSTQGSSNRQGIVITKSTDGDYKTCTIDNTVQQFIVTTGTQNNTYAFKCVNGESSNKYIYAASSSGNQLKSSDTLTDDASFTLSLDHQGNATLLAQGTNTRNHLQYYKSATSNLFSCYQTDNLEVAIYKYYSTSVVNAPVINVSSSTINVPNTESEGTINYTISNEMSGASISASTSANWISNFNYNANNKITFTVGAQEINTQQRIATITLSYAGATDVTVTIIQAAGEVNGGGPEPTNKTGWYRVESTDWLNVGDNIIIASVDEEYAMSTTQNISNRGVTEIYKNMDGSYETCNTSLNIQEFILEAGTINGTYAFKCSNGDNVDKYIYAASNSANQLKTYATLNDNGSFAISFNSDYSANIIAQGTNSRNTIRYYKSGDNRSFNCYASGQKPIIIYKKYQ